MTKIIALIKNQEKSIALPKKLADVKVSPQAISVNLKRIMANLHQKSAHTLSRGEIRGGGRKPWRQKGTGRARAGSIRSPLWKGGGVIFGPQAIKTVKSFPKKLNQKTILALIADRKEQLRILDFSPAKPKTKEFLAGLARLKVDGTTLMVGSKEANLKLSCQNISWISYLDLSSLNAYNIAVNKWLVFSKKAYEEYFQTRIEAEKKPEKNND